MGFSRNAKLPSCSQKAENALPHALRSSQKSRYCDLALIAFISLSLSACSTTLETLQAKFDRKGNAGASEQSVANTLDNNETIQIEIQDPLNERLAKDSLAEHQNQEMHQVQSHLYEAEQDASPSFSTNTLYQLLIAEIAAHRNQPEITLQLYVDQAKQTRDPGILKRAIDIASFMEDREATLELSHLWQKMEGDNPRANAMAADQLIHFNQRLEALDSIDKILASGNFYDFDLFNRSLDNAPQKNYFKLIEKLSYLSDQYPKNAQLLVSISRLQQLNGDGRSALAFSKKASQIDPQYAAAVILHGQQLFIFGKNKNEALSYLRSALTQFPSSKRLHIVYLQTLIALENHEMVAKHMDVVATTFPYDRELVFTISLLAWENEIDQPAKKYLTKLLDEGYRSEETHYYLGRIEASAKSYEEAVYHFEQIEVGPSYLAAQLHITLIYSAQNDVKKARRTLITARENQPSESETFYNAESELLLNHDNPTAAFVVLNGALKEYPQSTKLLYGRAMVAERLNMFNVLERDLAQIIEIDPDNSVALNALGYTLTDRTDRHMEALGYITKAYRLSPDDPAVIDSLGWVNYRLGNHEEALKHLQQANAMHSDQEIAAHLGEVLWVLGRKEEAMKVWQEAVEKNEQTHILEAVMERLID